MKLLPSKNIYVDQNTFSVIASSRDDAWQEHPIAKVLIEAGQRGEGEVWLSPAHVLETVQASDPSLRKRIAEVQLELSDGRRMWHGPQLEAVRDFMAFMEVLAPSTIRTTEYFDMHRMVEAKFWLGTLAMVVARPHVGHSRASEYLKRSKLQNRWLHARLLTQPDTWLAGMQRSLQSNLTAAVTPSFQAPEDDEQVQAEIEEMRRTLPGLAAKSKQFIAKNRDDITNLYGAAETWASVSLTFALPGEAHASFDSESIIQNWNSPIAPSASSLPSWLVGMAADDVRSGAAVWGLLWECVKRASKIPMMTSKVGYEALLRELEVCANQKRLPTGGLVFDMDHCSALMFANVFVTQDETLASSARTIAKEMERATHGQHAPVIATNATQLAKALRTS